LNGDAVRVAPELASKVGSLRNVLVQGSGRYAFNSAYVPSFVNVSGSWASGLSNQTSPTSVLSGNPRTDGSLKYITRIEAASPLKGAGYNGSDVGANVLMRYGTDGTRIGQAGYNSLSSTSLWPWPNEDRIKRDMCANTTRGFCSSAKRLDGSNTITLSSYIWETLGNPIPAGFYTK
jgi:hypothetical protein